MKHFLEQCLASVGQAMTGMEGEVIVVDNASTDNSLAYLQPLFPKVRFIANTENLGFAKACNQGWRLSTARYVLFLNPDTLVPEDCFQRCIAFMEQTPDAGALGIKMLDGSGRFLKESKRSFPSPLISLYKLAGLSRLFPRSRVFARYHLGHLDAGSNHVVDVLAGAFMLVRRELLEAAGGFDEVFFMYGEDVDLSYRLQQQPCAVTRGYYRNYYFAETPIVHFKGESTRKASMNYVRMFYSAMSLFVKKHYGASRAGIFNFMVHLAIWARAALSAIGRFIRAIGLPMIDAGLILLSFWLMKQTWTQFVKPDVQYETRLLWIAFPSFTIVYLITAYYAGLYDRWYRRVELVQSTLVATLVVLAVYSLLPEHYRFSRGMILFGALLAFLLIGILRRILIYTGVISRYRQRQEPASTLVVATEPEYAEVRQLLREAGLQHKLLGRIAINDKDSGSVGRWPELEPLHRTLSFRELLLVAGTLSYRDLIQQLPSIPGRLRIKWHRAGTRSIVGSDSKDSSGESLSSENGFRLANPHYRRLKRLLDVTASVAGILLWPAWLFVIKNPFGFLQNCVEVLLTRKTWLGYAAEGLQLPAIRKPVLGSNGLTKTENQKLPAESLQMLDYWYARDYDWANEWKTLWAVKTKLGNREKM